LRRKGVRRQGCKHRSRPLLVIVDPPVLDPLPGLCAPLMEVIPASGTSVGAAISAYSAGLLARDGLFVLAGAGLAAILPVSLWLLVT
jgi:hypothetical protein